MTGPIVVIKRFIISVDIMVVVIVLRKELKARSAWTCRGCRWCLTFLSSVLLVTVFMIMIVTSISACVRAD